MNREEFITKLQHALAGGMSAGQVAVLPLDAALCAEITKGRDEIKRCAVCGAAFTPNSNRAKYCPDCAVQVRRKKEAERQRKRYLLSTHLGR